MYIIRGEGRRKERKKIKKMWENGLTIGQTYAILYTYSGEKQKGENGCPTANQKKTG